MATEAVDPLVIPPEAINLREEYPVAFRAIFAGAFHWLAIYFTAVCIFIIAAITRENWYGFDIIKMIFEDVFLAVILGGFVLCLGKIVYEFFYRRYYCYGIEAGHLVITKGVFLRGRGSFPLSQITDVYLDRSIPDLVFALYRLHISTPSGGSEKFASIGGLGRSNAVGLQEYLTKLLETTHPPIDEEAQETATHNVEHKTDEGSISDRKSNDQKNEGKKQPKVAKQPQATNAHSNYKNTTAAVQRQMQR